MTIPLYSQPPIPAAPPVGTVAAPVPVSTLTTTPNNPGTPQYHPTTSLAPSAYGSIPTTLYGGTPISFAPTTTPTVPTAFGPPAPGGSAVGLTNQASSNMGSTIGVTTPYTTPNAPAAPSQTVLIAAAAGLLLLAVIC